MLRSYRFLFMTSEMVLLTSATLVLGLSTALLAVPIGALGVALLFVWISVCRARARAVVFIHWLIQRAERGEKIVRPYLSFREFQTSRTYAGMHVTADQDFISLSRTLTGRRMDIHVPALVGLAWLALLIVWIVQVS